MSRISDVGDMRCALIPMPPGVGLGSPGAACNRRVGALKTALMRDSRQGRPGYAMSLMPCFDQKQAYAESIVLARLLAGYGEIELQMCMCLVAVEGQIDTPIRQVFGKTGAERRIKICKKALRNDYDKANLTADLQAALSDLEWCRQIRNQYAHSSWFWTAPTGLCFVNLEEVANQPTTINSALTNRHRIDVPLLQAQEDFFWYVKQYLMYLETAYKTWNKAQSRGGARGPQGFIYPKPTKIARPPKHY